MLSDGLTRPRWLPHMEGSSPLVTARSELSRRPALRTDFEQALKAAADTARRSPSPYNCQPWVLAWMNGEDARSCAARLLNSTGSSSGNGAGSAAPRTDSIYLAVALDQERQLDALPSHRLEMQLSCGAFTQMLTRALACQGWWLERTVLAEDPGSWEYGSVPGPVRALGEESWRPSWTPLAVLELRYVGVPEGSLTEFGELAARRHTHRGPYEDQAVEPALLQRLLSASPGLAAEAPVIIRHLESREQRARFVDFVARTAGHTFSDPAAWREAHRYLRRDQQEAEELGDGCQLDELLGHQPSTTREALRGAALRPSAMRLLRHMGYPRLLASKLAATARHTPVVVTMGLTTANPGAADGLRGGARLADYWLAATRHGLAMQPLSVLVQTDHLRQRVQSTLALPGRTFFISRLGRPGPEQYPVSPRRPTRSFCHTL